MKKTAILLALIYGLSSTGVAVKANYCCEKLVSLQLILANDGKNKEGCCKVKFQSLKVNDTHAASDVLTTPAMHVIFLETCGDYLNAINTIHESDHLFVNDHAPPLLSSVPTYISNCVFRI